MSHNRRTVRNAGSKVQGLLCLALGLLLFLCGCGARTTKKTSSIKRAKTVEASVPELSSRNQSLLAQYSSEIENAADRIILASPSPRARRQALVWKAEAIPVLQTSLLNTDPVAAIIDTWVFVFQMTAYMQQPAVKEEFGTLQSVPIDTLKKMDEEMEQLVRTAAPSADIHDLGRRFGSWAAAHPIQSGLSGRRSADPELIQQAEKTDLGATASLQAIQESLGDITARLDSYNAFLPKQARWQVELLLSDLGHYPELSTAESNLASISRALEKTSGSMERLPEQAENAREVVLADVVGQRLAAQSFLEEERRQVFNSLTRERIDALGDLRRERLAATSDLRGEWPIVLHAMDEHLQKISERTLKDFDARSRDLIDHLFLRGVELVLLTLTLSFLAVWLLLRQFVSKRSATGKSSLDRAA